MSGLIPQVFLDELLHRTDIVELINSFVPLKKRGNSYLACCPFHNEKTPSFNVIEKKQFYHCFGCAASGNAISFVMSHLNQSFVEAVELLASRAGLTIPREQNPKTNQSISLYQILEQVAQFYQKTLKNNNPAIGYLKQRGINGLIAKQYELGFAIAGWNILEKNFKQHAHELLTTGMLVKKDNGQTYDRYRERVMFPIRDRKGHLIAFGGRVIDNQQKPKYLNSPESPIFQKNRELYGLYQAIQANSKLDNIIIVEGYLDVIGLAQFGITNAVATLGTATSIYHIQLLSQYTKQLIFCFDGDVAGRQAAWKALENCLAHLEDTLDVRFVFLPENHDPDSLVRQLGQAHFLEQINLATPLNQYLLESLSDTCELTSTAGKSQLIKAATPYLNAMPDGSYRQLLIDELARKTHMESHRISQLISKSAQTDTLPAQKSITRSPVRVAIALLLQHPEILTGLNLSLDTKNLDGEGQEIIHQLIDYISNHPTVTTAGLVEQWRDHDLFSSLNKLASWDHLVPEHSLKQEFSDIIQFLVKQNMETKINLYLEKSRKEGLTMAEQQLLQDIVKQRHQQF